MDLILTGLIIVIIFTAILTIETDNRTYLILLLLVFSILTGIAFIYVGALFSGIFQLIIYAGVMTTLFVSTIYMTNGLQTEPEIPETTKERVKA